MKIVVVYLSVIEKSSPEAPSPGAYQDREARFHRTYLMHRPKIAHEVHVVFCGPVFGAVKPFDPSVHLYDGPGWDCGAFQHVAPELKCDMAVFCNTGVYFHRSGWLERFVEAWERFGPGLYGASASYENCPHIRTPCFACAPSLLAIYPDTVSSHLDASEFECQFASLVMARGIPCRLVTSWDGFYEMKDWRRPENVFRKGDQTNDLVWDRHHDVWFAASPQEKAKLTRGADGK